MDNHTIMNIFKARHPEIKTLGDSSHPVYWKFAPYSYVLPCKNGGFTCYHNEVKKRHVVNVEGLEEFLLCCTIGVV